MEETYARLVAEQLVIEVKSAMPRAGVTSSRALGRLIGQSSQYMSMRLDGGSPHTGKRVPLDVEDLVAIAEALGVAASQLVAAAEDAVRARLTDELGAPPATPAPATDIAPRRGPRTGAPAGHRSASRGKARTADQ